MRYHTFAASIGELNEMIYNYAAKGWQLHSIVARSQALAEFLVVLQREDTV